MVSLFAAKFDTVVLRTFTGLERKRESTTLRHGSARFLRRAIPKIT
jgi:hypothetical protein